MIKLIKLIGEVVITLLAPTGALIVLMVYYISAAAAAPKIFRFSLSPSMQLMLQVSLKVA